MVCYCSTVQERERYDISCLWGKTNPTKTLYLSQEIYQHQIDDLMILKEMYGACALML